MRLPPGSRQRALAVAAAAGALAGAIVGAWVAALIARASVRRALRLARLAFRVATLTLYRPCADCHQWLHADARVCHRCGYRDRTRSRR